MHTAPGFSMIIHQLVYIYVFMYDILFHSDKKKLYTGMQPLVFPCYTHVLHRNSISYIYTCV